MLWYVMMAVIVVGGLALVGFSRYQKLHPTTAAAVAPTKTDNWHAAFAIDICGTVKPNLAANSNFTTAGIRTFGDGVIDVNPGAVTNSSAFTGAHDTLATFIATYGRGFALTATSLTLPGPVTTPSTSTSSSTTSTPTSTSTPSSTSSSTPSSTSSTTKSTTSSTSKTKTKAVTAGASSSSSSSTSSSSTTSTVATTTTAAPVGGPTYRNGQSCPSTSKAPGKAYLVAKVWPSPTGKPQLVTSNIGGLKILNGQMITLAFVPKGTAIPMPPSRSTLLQNLGGAGASSGKK